MAGNLGINEAELLGLFLSSTFWGILLITWYNCVRRLLWDAEGDPRPMKTINWSMFCVTMLLGILSTLDVSLCLMLSIEAFILYTGPGGADARFTGLTDWVNISKTCTHVFGKIISDGVLVYRCWVIYSKNWFVVALSIMLWCGCLALAIFVIFLEASANNPKILLTGGLARLTPSITAGWIISLANNIISTGLIVWRIMRVDRENIRYAIYSDNDRSLFGRKRTKLQNVTRIIIESGAMYTTISFIAFVTYVVNSNSFYPVTDAELQILSIAFNLIIIRISTRPAEDFSLKATSTQPQSFHMRNMNSSNCITSTTGPVAMSKPKLEMVESHEEGMH